MKWIGQHKVTGKVKSIGSVTTGGPIKLQDTATGVIFEGATDNAHKTTFNVIDPTDTRAINLPDASGTVALTSGVGDGLSFDGSTANGLCTYKDADEISVESTFTYDSSINLLNLSSSSGGTLPFFKLSNSHTGAAGPGIQFVKSANGAADDILGKVTWLGDDDGGNTQTYAELIATIKDATAGSEAGILELQVAENDGTVTTGLKLEGQPSDDGEVDVAIGAGAASTTTIAGTLTMGSTAAITNAGQLSVAAQPNITTLAGFVTGSANQILTDDGDGTVTSESTFTYNGLNLDVEAVASSFTHGTSANVIINNTGNNAAGGTLILKNERNSGTTASQDGDILGLIQFNGRNDAGTPGAKTFVEIRATAPDVSDGAEEGQLSLKVSSHDGEMQPGVQLFSGDAEDEVDVTIGNGSTSLTTIAGTLTIGSTAAMTNAGLLSVAAQTNITSLGTLTGLTTSGAIELGHADDTTIARSAAGIVTIEGNQIFTTKIPALTSGAVGVPAVTMQTRRTITTAEANDMHNTTIELVPLQGSNNVIVPLGGMIRVDRASAQLNSSCDLNMHIGNHPGVYGSTSLGHIRRFMNGEAGDRVFNITAMIGSYEVGQSISGDANKPLQISFDAAATTDCFTSIDVFLTYQVISIA